MALGQVFHPADDVGVEGGDGDDFLVQQIGLALADAPISASENAPWPQVGDSCESSAPCEAAKVIGPFSVLEKSLTRLATSTPAGPRPRAAIARLAWQVSRKSTALRGCSLCEQRSVAKPYWLGKEVTIRTRMAVSAAH